MGKEIGSYFFDYKDFKNENNPKVLLTENFKYKAYLSSGRDAIKLAIKEINGAKRALLPGFTCETVIKPFIAAGFEVSFYDINKDLTVNVNEFVNKINENKPSIILVHSYFGFDTLKNIRHILKKIGESEIVLIEDITQDMYSNFPKEEANYLVGSLRKWMAIPDGGFLFSKDIEIKGDKNLNTNNKLVEYNLKAFKKKSLYMENGNKDLKNEFRALFENGIMEMEEWNAIYKISPISKRIYNGLNVEYMKMQRKLNYKFLLENIKNFKNIKPILTNITLEVVPLYFPVLIDKSREEIQSKLASKKIYCPVIWPMSKHPISKINDDTEYVYNHILCIPCDQRYDINDMKRIVKEIEKLL